MRTTALNASNPDATRMAVGRLPIAADGESLTKPMTVAYRCERPFVEDIARGRQGYK